MDNMDLTGINVRAYPDEPCIEEQLAAQFPEHHGQQPKKPLPATKSIPKPTSKTSAKELSSVKPLSARTTSTINSRNAASALSKPKTSTITVIPKAGGAPTAKSKLPSSVVTSKKKTPAPTNPSVMRHTAAAAASNTTLGYGKGRNVSRSLNQTQSSKHSAKPSTASSGSDTTLTPARYLKERGPPPFGSELYARFSDMGLFREENDDDLDESFKGITPSHIFAEDPEFEDFELAL